ncbi:MAG: hypothetical protein KDD83_18130, partial [Caldilineaceae bacterium]|nr:hypothetical protein [Caldilineaceae bacterium]
PLPPRFNLAIAGVTVVWMFVQRAAWRGLWFERFLDMLPSGGDQSAPAETVAVGTATEIDQR